MQALSDILMPRVPKGGRVELKGAQKQSFVSNHYPIRLTDKKSIFQYNVSVEPEIPKDSSYLYDKMLTTLKEDLKKGIGYVAAKGEMVWGWKDSKIAQTHSCKFTSKTIAYSFTVLLKPIKEILLKDFLNESPDKIAAVCQILNINTKNILKEKLKMTQLGMGRYYCTEDFLKSRVEETGLSVWRGYKVSVVPINSKPYLQVDVCSRVLREENFLRTIEQEKRKHLSPNQINQKYTGVSILMRYGNQKFFRIEQIDFTRTPKDTFDYTKSQNGKITYEEYYKRNYNIKIDNLKQPLIRVQLEKSKVPNAVGQLIEVVKYGYMIPELMSLTGMTDEERKDFRIMKALDRFTKLTAQERMRESEGLLDKLSREKDLMYTVNLEAEHFPGFRMYEPKILTGNNRSLQIKNGSINLRERVKDPAEISNAIFIYSVGRKLEQSQNAADFALDKLLEASKAFEIVLQEPTIYQVKGNKVSDWKDRIASFIDKKGPPSIIIAFLDRHEEKFYSQLKRQIINQYNIPSQMIRKRTLSSENKGVLSCASKILLQINVKLGHCLWQVAKSHPYWQKKTVALAAISFSKGRNGQTVSFVGTRSKDLANIYCDCKQIKNKEELSVKFYQSFFVMWFQNWFKSNKDTFPDAIIIYREGLNEVQAKKELAVEIEALKETLLLLPIKAKIEKYFPQFQYILVNRKVNTRMYLQTGQGNKRVYTNPDSGSIIFEELSSDNYNEFFLASVNVNQGTCTPVQFKVGCENSNIPRDAIAELTYDQCFNYFNWNGAVRVPGVLQYANKLAKMFSEHVKEPLNIRDKKSQFKCQPFFM